MQYSDASLILLWQKGDEKAFDCLYKRYVLYLINIAIKKTNTLEDAKDCVQEVFISIYHRKKFLHPIISLKAYLYKTLQNKVYNFKIKELTRNQYEQTAADQINHTVDDVIEDYKKALSQFKKGDTISVLVKRGSEEKTLQVTF